MSTPKKNTHGTYRAPAPSTHKTTTAAPHSKERFRVRDKNWTKIWGQNLSHADAVKLKTKVTSERRSKTARVESMSVPPPADLPPPPDPKVTTSSRPGRLVTRQDGKVISVTPVAPPARAVIHVIEKGRVVTRNADGARSALKHSPLPDHLSDHPDGTRLVRSGDSFELRPSVLAVVPDDGGLAAAQGGALAAASASAAEANERARAAAESAKRIAAARGLAAEVSSELGADGDAIDESSVNDLVDAVGGEPEQDELDQIAAEGLVDGFDASDVGGESEATTS